MKLTTKILIGMIAFFLLFSFFAPSIFFKQVP